MMMTMTTTTTMAYSLHTAGLSCSTQPPKKKTSWKKPREWFGSTTANPLSTVFPVDGFDCLCVAFATKWTWSSNQFVPASELHLKLVWKLHGGRLARKFLSLCCNPSFSVQDVYVSVCLPLLCNLQLVYTYGIDRIRRNLSGVVTIPCQILCIYAYIILYI